MTFHPKVSIIIPVYNGSNFLAEAIDSALAQTYDNFEVVVINDGSKDDSKTAQIARSYGQKIRYYEKENGGVATALNMGVEKMEGEYFSWLSHDDRYLPEKLTRQVDTLQKYIGQKVILYTDFDLIDEYSHRFGTIHVTHVDPVIFAHELVRYNLVHGCSTLIPKQAFEETGEFNPTFRAVQDYDMWFRMAESYDFVHMREVLIESRIHRQQDTLSMTERCIAEGNELFIRQLRHFADVSYSGRYAQPKADYYYRSALGLTHKYCFDAADFAYSLYAKQIPITQRYKQALYYRIIRTKYAVLITAQKIKSKLKK